MKVLNFGSCNVDYVYSMSHIVREGETIPAQNLELFAGGKGFALQGLGFAPNDLRQPLAAAEVMGERTEAPPVAEEARRASEKIRSIATKGARRLYFRGGNEKSHPRNQKKAHICLPRQCVLFSTK